MFNCSDYLFLDNETVLEKVLNTTLDETIELSAIVQFEIGNTIIPCVTVNPPTSIGSPTQGSFMVRILKRDLKIYCKKDNSISVCNQGT